MFFFLRLICISEGGKQININDIVTQIGAITFLQLAASYWEMLLKIVSQREPVQRCWADGDRAQFGANCY